MFIKIFSKFYNIETGSIYARNKNKTCSLETQNG